MLAHDAPKGAAHPVQALRSSDLGVPIDRKLPMQTAFGSEWYMLTL
jgi:hypothetical protein